MRTTLFMLALANLGASLVSWPNTPVSLAPLNYPRGALNAMLKQRDSQASADCPAQPNSCGVVTFKGGMYTTFGQGVCMQLGLGVESIYVSKCYCSLWSACEGHAEKDVYVDGMMMCEKPRKMDEFDSEVKFISCGGLN